MIEQMSYEDLLKLSRSGMFVGGTPVITAAGERRVCWFIATVDAQAFATGHHPIKKVRAAQALGVLTHVRQYAPRSGLTPA